MCSVEYKYTNLGFSNSFLFFCFKLFVGFGFPYEGPAPLEAIANGCIFLQPKFNPSRSSLNNEFFRGKPMSREVSPNCSTEPEPKFMILVRKI